MAMQKRVLLSNITARAFDAGTENKYIVEGYAAVFNNRYTLRKGAGWEWQETIDKNAFDGCEMADVLFQYNHEGRVLARTTNGTLTLNTDERGLHVTATLGGTDDGRALWQDIQGGYVNKMSFSFLASRVEETEERVQGASGGRVYLDTIKSFERVYDVSAVSIPANEETEIEARSKDFEARQCRAKEREEKATAAADNTGNSRTRMARELSLSIALNQ